MSENEMPETDQNTPLSLDDAIDAAAQEIASSDDIDEQSASTDGVDASDGDGGDRPRDEHGRFVKSEDAPDTEAAPADDDEITDQGGDVEQFEAESAPPIEPPASWSAAARAEWLKLPRPIQEEVVKREGDVSRGFEQNATKAKQADDFLTALEPIRASLDLNGTPPAQAVSKLVHAQKFLETNPVEAIRWLANSYGVDLSAVTQAAAASEPSDPTVAALQRQVVELRNHLQQEAQQREVVARTQTQAQIDSFRNATNDAGAHLHPHFSAVENHMAALLSGGLADDLESAYSQAVYANPQIREQILREQNVEQQRKRQDADARKSAEAKRIAKTNIQGGAAKGASPARTLDEMVDEAARQVGAA